MKKRGNKCEKARQQMCQMQSKRETILHRLCVSTLELHSPSNQNQIESEQPALLAKVVSSIVILQLGPVGPPPNKPFSNSMEASRSLAMAIGLKMVSFLITQLVPGGQWQLSF